MAMVRTIVYKKDGKWKVESLVATEARTLKSPVNPKLAPVLHRAWFPHARHFVTDSAANKRLGTSSDQLG